MSAQKGTRLFKLASRLNIGKDAIVEFLLTKGITIENKPTTSLSDDIVSLILDKFEKEQKAEEIQYEKLEKHNIVRHDSVAIEREPISCEVQSEQVTYRDSENQGTYLYGAIQDKTSVYSELISKEKDSLAYGIGIGDKLTLKGREFLITNIISDETLEAVIYKVESRTKNTYALKLYFESRNSKKEPNFETLHRIMNITNPNVLKLFDFGVGIDKYLGKHCYEISAFAEGGNFFSVDNFKEKYNLGFIENQVVRSIFQGIKELHKNKIYHCDLKPQNIFYLDKNQSDIIIGDYGSAKAYDLETEKELRKTSTVNGTDAYLAPEQARGIISEKNDYYSFGVILLHLLYPEQLSSEKNILQIDKGKFEKIVERQYNSQPVVDFKLEYKRLNNLIEGLTLINHINRFGKNEVEKWLNGEEVEVKYKSESNSIQPISLSNQRAIKTVIDLIDFLATEVDWRDELIEDETTKNEFFRWIDNTRGKDERKRVKEILNYYTIEDSKTDKQIRISEKIGYSREALIRYFDPEREIRIDMNFFNFFTSTNIKKDVDEYISKLDEIWKITSIDKLRFYIFQLEFSLRQLKKSVINESAILVGSLIDKVYSVFGLVQKPFDDFKTEIQTKINSYDESETYRLLINLFYVFNPQRTFHDSNNTAIKSIDELGLFYVQNESSFSDKYLGIEKEKFLEKSNKIELSKLDYKQFIFEIFKDKTEAQVEIINLTIDKDHVYIINYKFYKSLNTFFLKNKISRDFTSRSEENEVYRKKRGFFQSFKSIFENYISTITYKHNITTITNQNRSQIKKKLRRDSWKRYFYIRSGHLLVFILFLTFLFLFNELLTGNLHFDKNLSPYFMEPNAYQQKMQSDLVKEQKKAADLVKEQKRIAEEKASLFLSTAKVKSIKIYSGGVDDPAFGNRYYTNTFTVYEQYIYFEVNLSHRKPDTRTDFEIHFTIYKDNRKFGESSFSTYALPEWDNSYRSGRYGSTALGFWKAGKYRVEMRAGNRSLGRQYFNVQGVRRIFN